MSRAKTHSSFFGELKAVIRGEQRDYTAGSLSRAISLLAIPMVLEASMQAVFEVADVFFVGMLGAEAVAAVGLIGGIVTLVYGVAVGISMAATAVVARRIGEHKPEQASTAAVQAILLTLVAGIPLALVGIFFPRQALMLMGATPEVAEIGYGYCAVMLGANSAILFLFVLNAIFRGAGDAGIAMWVLTLANLLNIALDPIFIFGWGPIPAMGTTGAAIATVLGRGAAIAVQLYLLGRGRGRMRIAGRHLYVDWPVLQRLSRLAATAVLQFLVGMASWMLMLRIASQFGSAALAGYTIAVRLIIFALLPTWGLGTAAATLVGQNLGAGKPERAERSAWVSSFVSAGFLAFLGLLFMWWARDVLMLFSSDPEVIRVGVNCLMIVCPSYLFLAFGMVLVQAFNGAGDAWTPTWINLICYWLVQLPLAWALAVQSGLGIEGIFVTIAITELLLSILAVIVFRRGGWKGRMV